jgi:hypothetical protein
LQLFKSFLFELVGSFFDKSDFGSLLFDLLYLAVDIELALVEEFFFFDKAVFCLFELFFSFFSFLASFAEGLFDFGFCLFCDLLVR